MKKNNYFSAIFIVTTVIFSYFGFNSYDIKIIGPEFFEIAYFEDELKLIEDDLGISIGYKSVADPETFIVNNPDSNFDIAIIPNPQGVINLAERNLIKEITNIKVDEKYLDDLYPHYLKDEVVLNKKMYGGWLRLFSNSLLWFDVKKIENHSDIDLSDFNNLAQYTKNLADDGRASWCLNSESGSAQGLIQTNWMEHILVSGYGPEIYKKWSDLSINSSNVKIFSSIKFLGDIFFYEGTVFGGTNSIMNLEFKNLPNYLLSDETPCFLALGGHYFYSYIPKKYEFEKDYNFVSMPDLKYKDYLVGFGDSVVILNDKKNTNMTFSKLLSKNFGKVWSSKLDGQYISANLDFEIQNIANPFIKKESYLINKALIENKFMYDASDVMARPIGANKLWKALAVYFNDGIDADLVAILNELDKNY